MTDKPITADSIQSLWQTMPTDPITVSIDDMRARSLRFERRIRRRNLTEYVAGAIVVIVFSWYATWPEPATPLWPIANLMIVGAAIYVGWMLHKHGGPRKVDPAATVSDLIAFHRAELARQRDGLRTVWRWYILPFVPGTVLWFAAMATASGAGKSPGVVLVSVGFFVMVMVLVFAGTIALNLLAAAHLQRQIDDLDRYSEKD